MRFRFHVSDELFMYQYDLLEHRRRPFIRWTVYLQQDVPSGIQVIIIVINAIRIRINWRHFFRCHKMTCYKDNSNNKKISVCISDFDCSKDQVCFDSICKNMTDLPRRGGGRFPLFQVEGGPDDEDENNLFYNN